MTGSNRAYWRRRRRRVSSFVALEGILLGAALGIVTTRLPKGGWIVHLMLLWA